MGFGAQQDQYRAVEFDTRGTVDVFLPTWAISICGGTVRSSCVAFFIPPHAMAFCRDGHRPRVFLQRSGAALSAQI